MNAFRSRQLRRRLAAAALKAGQREATAPIRATLWTAAIRHDVILALAGGVILLCPVFLHRALPDLFYTHWIPVQNNQTTRIHSTEIGLYSGIVESFEKQSQLIELWSWTAPSQLTEQETQQVVVRCRLRRRVTISAGVRGPQTEEEEVSKSVYPMELVIEGSFWDKPQTQTIPAGQPTPLEWRWTVTGHTPSKNQIIQITLPPVNTDERNAERFFGGSIENQSPGSRFITLNVPVVSTATPWVPTTLGNLVSFLGWAIGGGLLAPGISGAIRKLSDMIKKRQPRVVLPDK